MNLKLETPLDVVEDVTDRLHMIPLSAMIKTLGKISMTTFARRTLKRTTLQSQYMYFVVSGGS